MDHPKTIEDIPTEILELIISFVPEIYRIFINKVCRSWTKFKSPKISQQEIFTILVNFGDLNCLEFIIKNGFRASIDRILKLEFSRLITKHHNEYLLQWAILRDNLDYNMAFRTATKQCNIDSLKFLWKKWNWTCNSRGFTFASHISKLCNEKICAAAARHGRLDILKWLRQKGFPWDDRTCVDAIRNNHFDVLKWAMKCGCPRNVYHNVIYVAILNGNPEIINWLHKKRVPLNGNENLSKYKKLSQTMMPWCEQHGYANESLSEYVVRANHITLFKWIIEEGSMHADILPHIINHQRYEMLILGAFRGYFTREDELQYYDSKLRDWFLSCINTKTTYRIFYYSITDMIDSSMDDESIELYLKEKMPDFEKNIEETIEMICNE